tara:strand:- start:1078 stop:1704 length:627 start_codon:yes stop_codon:yes gene_type:complete
MTGGYNITCDPGALGMQKCYVNVNSPTGCTTGTPGCTTTRQEIIGYTAGGDPVSKGQSSSPWMAWIPQVTTLNQDGNAYQPYGPAGIPYTLDGGSLEKWTPAGAGSEQALAYLDSAPGAQAREMYQERTCSPLWSNVFGCKEGGTIWVHNDAIAEHEPSFFDKLKALFGAEEYKADVAVSASWKGIAVLVASLGVLGVVGARAMKKGE